MNREIKFRGKRVDNGEWVYGNYHYFSGITQMRERIWNPPYYEDKPVAINCHYILVPRLPDTTGWNIQDSFSAIRIVPETVGQYTNIKDANGKEIYEDDVVNNQAATWVVKFNKGCFCGDRINAPELSRDTLIALRAIGPEKWVLGNIHDNPDLLKQ